MNRFNIAQILNGKLLCTRCRTSDTWVPMVRPTVRQYSSIHRLRCANCGEQVVAKVVGGKYSSEYALVHARKEYESLCALQCAFPQNERYGTLVPLGHFEFAGRGVVITRLVPGEDLTHYVRTLDVAGVQAVCGSAGGWLKKLHESDVQDQQGCLGAEEKVSDLAGKYDSVLRSDPGTRTACDLLADLGSGMDAVPVPAVRQHGDFKPGNMLCNGNRYVGLDIVWRNIGAAVYDLAPFLNHLWLVTRRLPTSRKEQLYDLAETRFLAGYDDEVDMRALRWTQLYFALHNLGGYRKRGWMAATYANWTVWPLVRKLTTQLQEIG